MAEPEILAAIARLRAAALDRAAGRPVGSDKLIQLGLDALLTGVDTLSLRMLAGLGRREEPEAQELFDATIDELGLRPQIPDDEVAALWLLARETAADIVSGKVSPLKGAETIWQDFADPLDFPQALKPFVDAIAENAIAEAYGPERAASLDEIDADIVRAARELPVEPPTLS